MKTVTKMFDIQRLEKVEKLINNFLRGLGMLKQQDEVKYNKVKED